MPLSREVGGVAVLLEVLGNCWGLCAEKVFVTGSDWLIDNAGTDRDARPPSQERCTACGTNLPARTSL